MLGAILVKVAFVSCLASVLCYFQSHRTGNPALLRWGRMLFIVTVLGVFAVAGVLLSLILTHQFQYTYVWSYSSRSLSTPLLISTFYAGQEGSFTLWTLYMSVIGIFLILYSSKKDYEPQVMSVFGTIELMLLVMLMVKNPFLRVWESWPGQVASGFAPPDGRGLNPLLQNYWMVIHPQVLFSGFSAMSVPYAYAVAALMKRDYRNWIRPATPWLVFAATILGTGIMMAGFWAYETLGWGGYWGWDPVENSSLVPWLVAVATLHTILSQRKSGSFIRTNLLLGMLCFIMVLYSTFLTRSGVLGDTSVHSFVDPGMWAYWLLIGMMALFAGLGGGLMILRLREIPKPEKALGHWSRESALFLGSCALVSSAILVTVGTSSPIITDVLEGKKAAMDVSYYAHTMPFEGIAIGLLSGVGQLLWWNRSNKREVLKSMRLPMILAAAATVLMALYGVRDVLLLVFLFFAAFSLFANLGVGLRIVRGNPKFAGGSLAHVGLAIMFIGFVASAKYDTKETVSLPQGRTASVLGYHLTYLGYGPIDNERYAFKVSVERDGRRNVVMPIMYYSKYNDGLMRNPDILNLITKDFYLAPLSLQQKDDSTQTTVQKAMFKRGEKKKLGGLDVTFVDFNFPESQKEAMLEGQKVKIGATLEVRDYGKKPVRLTPYKVIGGGEATDEPAKLGGEYEFTITGMSPDRESRENSTVEIGVQKLVQASQSPAADQPDILVAEASIKPFINLVWSGVIVVLVGFIVTIVRRSQEASQTGT